MLNRKQFNLVGYSDDDGRKIIYSLNLHGNTTIIDGDSGTGKTLMCQVAKQMIANNADYLVTYDTDNKSSLNVNILKQYKNKLIIIDNADLIVYGDILEYILNDRNNHYILFRRNNYDVRLSPNYYAKLVKNDKNIRYLEYLSTNPRWY